MATPELAPDSPLDVTENQSAPCSADFLLSSLRQSNSNKRKQRPPIVRGLHQKKVPTTEAGLVDLDELKLFMHRNSHYVPLRKRPGWKYHHVNHPESSFEQESVAREERDQGLIALRRSSYQQVHMRISSEMVYHLAHKIQVPHPASETVEEALRVFENLDMLGATCLYLNLARGNRQYRIDEGLLEPNWAMEVSVRERIDFMTEVREDYARALVRTEVVPHRVVTSAIKRLSIHLNDPYLDSIANRRLASDPVFYPLRVPAHKTLQDKANRLMALEFQSRQEQAA